METNVGIVQTSAGSSKSERGRHPSREIAPRLPHDFDTERNVLGAFLLDNDALDAAFDKLRPDDFFQGDSLECPAPHRVIYQQMLAMRKQRQPVDLLTIKLELERAGKLESVGGPAYLASLEDGIPRVSNVNFYVQKIAKAADLRRWAHRGQAITNRALEGDATPEDLRAMVGEFISMPDSSRGRTLRAVSATELIGMDFKPREMLLDPILPTQGLAMLYSFRGLGKTYFGIGIGAAIASGSRFLRWHAPKPRNVLIVDGELPGATLRDRARMILGSMERLPEPGALRFITPDMQEFPIPDLSTVEGQRILEPHLETVDLMILDNLSALCRSGVENESESWLPIQEWALALRSRGKSSLFIHHAGKNLTQRGTSRREDLLDTVVTLRHPKDYNPVEGLRCEVHFEKTRGMLGESARPFEVRMETGQDGSAVWTLKEIGDSSDVCDAAAGLFATGMSTRAVAKELGISKTKAARLLAEFRGAPGEKNEAG